MGSVYKQRKSPYYWIQYFRNGIAYRESTKSPNLSFARRLLRKREGDIAEGKIPSLKASKTAVNDLIRLYLKDYEDNKRRTLKEAKRYAKLLENYFGDMLASDVTTEDLMDYRAKRRLEKVQDSTINRELSALRRMFTLGREHEPPLVTNPLVIHLVEEYNVRTGFFEHDEFLALRGALPDHLKVVATIGYYTGMRLGKILDLRWDQIDWDHRMIRLNPGTKTKKVGHIPLIEQLVEVLERWQKVTKGRWPACPWVCHYSGRKIGQIKRGWKSACEQVGLEGRLFHDFRRTASRNLIRAGIPQSVVMEITGHKTDSVFRRYDIVSDEDKKEAAIRYAQYMRERASQVENRSKNDIPEESCEPVLSEVIDN